jgi:hypothetical protein
MDKKESLKLLDKYINALKTKAEAQENIRKVDSVFKVDPSGFDVPFVKILTPFLGVFAVIALAIRVAFSSSLNYHNELPITAGLFIGAAAAGLIFAKLVHMITKRKAQKNLKALEMATLAAKLNKINEYQDVINKAGYKIALAESELPVSCHSLETAKMVKTKLLTGKAETLEEASGGYTASDWEEAYNPNPKMFKMPDGTVFGGYAITEATRTVLPKDPVKAVSNEEYNISDWRMVLVSLTKDDALGDRDYYETIAGLEKYIIDSNDDAILIRGLTLKELEKLLGS